MLGRETVVADAGFVVLLVDTLEEAGAVVAGLETAVEDAGFVVVEVLGREVGVLLFVLFAVAELDAGRLAGV